MAIVYLLEGWKNYQTKIKSSETGGGLTLTGMDTMVG